MVTPAEANAADLELELEWLVRVIDARMKSYFELDEAHADAPSVTPPELGDSPYAAFVREHRLDFAHRLTLILVLTPHVRPRALDVFFLKNKTFDRPFTEFGGEVVGGAFMPTGDTVAFLLAGNELSARFAVMDFLLDPNGPFARAGVLALQRNAESGEGAPALHQRLVLSPEFALRFTTGAAWRPVFGSQFPAALVETPLSWEDMVLDPRTLDQLEAMRRWLRHDGTLRGDWGMGKHMQPGCPALFHGPPGTGKTLAAALLGKQLGRDVYRIDLSHLVSKYIGETEKNLSRLFAAAHNRQWVLLFDEADALFGKRSEVKDSHDRYANQELSYLLQRIESHDGVAILATNLKHNIDPAFLRRLRFVIHFPMPEPAERLRLWQQMLPPSSVCALDPAISLEQLAQRHALTGASIASIIQHACMCALDKHPGQSVLEQLYIEQAIHQEFAKLERRMTTP